jgi:hypothetical protein
MHNWRDNTPWQGFDPTIFRFAVNICISAMVVWHSGHRIHLRNKKTWVQIPPGYKVFFFGQRPLVPLLLLGPPFFPIILFGSTTLLTGMTGISLHMQWPLTSQLHGSVSQRERLVFLLRIKLQALIRLQVSPPSFDTGARNGIMCGSQLSHLSLKKIGLAKV